MITKLPNISELIAQCPELLITPKTQNIIVDLDHQNDCIVVTHYSLDEDDQELDRTYIFVMQDDGTFVLEADSIDAVKSNDGEVFDNLIMVENKWP